MSSNPSSSLQPTQPAPKAVGLPAAAGQVASARASVPAAAAASAAATTPATTATAATIPTAVTTLSKLSAAINREAKPASLSETAPQTNDILSYVDWLQNWTQESVKRMNICTQISKQAAVCVEKQFETPLKMLLHLGAVRQEIASMLDRQQKLISENEALKTESQFKSHEADSFRSRIDALKESNSCLKVMVECLQSQIMHNNHVQNASVNMGQPFAAAAAAAVAAAAAAVPVADTGVPQNALATAGSSGLTDTNLLLHENYELVNQVEELKARLDRANQDLKMAAMQEHGHTALVQELSATRNIVNRLEVQVQGLHVRNHRLLQQNQHLEAAVEMARRRRHHQRSRARSTAPRPSIAPVILTPLTSASMGGAIVAQHQTQAPANAASGQGSSQQQQQLVLSAPGAGSGLGPSASGGLMDQ